MYDTNISDCQAASIFRVKKFRDETFVLPQLSETGERLVSSEAEHRTTRKNFSSWQAR